MRTGPDSSTIETRRKKGRLPDPAHRLLRMVVGPMGFGQRPNNVFVSLTPTVNRHDDEWAI
jgi:hypothetical protein